MKHLPTLIAASLLVLTVGAADAQNQRGGPPKLDIDAMAADLNVSGEQLQACLGPRPAKGERPARPDPVAIADCLSSTNANITSATVEGVLHQHAPRPPRG